MDAHDPQDKLVVPAKERDAALPALLEILGIFSVCIITLLLVAKFL